MIARRNFLRGLFAAPAIVAAGSLMPIKGVTMRSITDWQSDAPERLDVLYGHLQVRPEWNVIAEEYNGLGYSIAEEVMRPQIDVLAKQVADSVMNSTEVIDLLTVDMITKEAVRLFQNSNEFLKEMNKQYAGDKAFFEGQQWGKQLRVRLPADFKVVDTVNLVNSDHANDDWSDANRKNHEYLPYRAEKWHYDPDTDKIERHVLAHGDIMESAHDAVRDMRTGQVPNLLKYNKERRTIDHVAPEVSALAVAGVAAVGVAKVIEENPVVSRRFWSKS